MKRCFILLVLLGVTWGYAPLWGTTYYVRTDGGTCRQCTGKTDAPYPGSGVNQPCAWSHPYCALDSNGNWIILGGDTVIIGPGSYMMGYGAPNTGWCEAEGAYECHLPPLPSGPDQNHPTRILGKGWDSGCVNPPELWGTERIWNVLDLTGSSNVVIACLEITDHSGCVEFHSNPSAECERDQHPYGNWADTGILASDSSNVTLKNLDIHGLASAGVRAGRISNWTIEDVRIAGNGWVGWEGDIDGGDSNSGTLYFKELIIEWNGCGETYPGQQPHNCWAQSAGGYGDGLGTGRTGGNWVFEDCIFRYNTSDGLDLLYVREPGGSIVIKRTMSHGNSGNQIKTNGDTSIENCVMAGNCTYFNGQSFTYNVDECRAGGTAVALFLRRGSKVSVINSTIAGQGDCLGIVECDDASCNGSELVLIQNNIFRGYTDYGDPDDLSCYFWFDQTGVYQASMDYNVIYNAKMGSGLTYAAHDINSDPKLVNDSLHNFDGHLTAGSPAVDSGLPVGALGGKIPANDLEGSARPVGSGVDRGAYEYGGSPAAGQIVLDRNALYFGAVGTSAVSNTQKIAVSNGGMGTMNWTASASHSWLNCTPRSGTGSGELTVSADTSGLGAGTYYGSISVSSADASNSPQAATVTLKVYNAGQSAAPFGVFETPVQGAEVNGSIAVTGWALDDIGIASVDIHRLDGGSLVYIGKAVLVQGARSDVEGQYPTYPDNDWAGWGYMMLTNFLPNQGNGTFKIRAVATDKDGHSVSLGTRTIICGNAHAVSPFGAIDIPEQGGEASGTAFRNYGWALTPLPNKIPVTGTTIDVYIDSIARGHPVYNIRRPDIAAYFPGYANSEGAIGYFDIDTTTYTDGVHTIAWTATDNAGNSGGFGSRFFTVSNNGNRAVRQVMRVPRPPAAHFPAGRLVPPPPGYCAGVRLKDHGGKLTRQKLSPGEDGTIALSMKQLEHLELHLGQGEIPGGEGNIFSGYLLARGQVRALPAGSTLDAAKGIFYWLPAPGFLGKYRLVFVAETPGKPAVRMEVLLTVEP